jgi:ectoine hydroxylase-related dioxygenase (phytanoyl-CoA dioxygenase family)
VIERQGIKIPGTRIRTGDHDGINTEDASYFGNVFDQLINLWQTSERVKKLMRNPQLGRMACQLSGAKGIRIWHDQALIKQPWANPTTLHLDTPFWSFSSRDALSIWIALDDVTLSNGCLYFLPRSHLQTNFQNIGITSNMNAIFQVYPEMISTQAVAAPMKAGSASFHNGLCIHGAGPNMTPYPRRAMTCAYMPDGSTYNGQRNILSEDYAAQLAIGDLLADETQNPLLFSGMDS